MDKKKLIKLISQKSKDLDFIMNDLYTLFEKFIPKIISNKYKNIPIYIYDRNGKYFNKAIGVTETLKLIGGKSRSSLYNALNLNKPYKGF